MPGFSSRWLTDEIAFLDAGLPMTTLAAGGTHSGSPMIWGGTPPLPWRKIGWIVQGGAGISATFYVQTATASAGAFATFTSPNQTASAASMSGTAPTNILYAEARGEMIEDLATRGYWIQPVLVTSGATSLLALGFLTGDSPPNTAPGQAGTASLTTFFLM